MYSIYVLKSSSASYVFLL